MERRFLGRTGLEITQLSYGAMEIRGARLAGDEQAETILNAVLDGGINFVDTSPDYGMSEEYIGRFISHRRGEYYLATKCGCAYEPGKDHVWTRERLLRNIETSLRRMKTDCVDVWQLHNATVEDVDAGDLVKIMEEVKQSGKVRWIGASSILPHLATFVGREVFDTFQIPYSALQREHEKVIKVASQAGIGVIIRGGVARGAPDEAGQGKQDRWETWVKAGLDELRASGESQTAFLLRFTLSHPHMHATIVGTMNPDHLAENLRAAEAGPLAPDVYAEAKRRLDGVGEKPTGGMLRRRR